MLFQHRKEKILDKLAEKTTVSIQELVAELEVSESTLRRDLVALEEEQLLDRVHGGATIRTDIGKELKMSQKENINQDLKTRVAKYASRLVQPESQIYVDAGTATLELVRFLPDHSDIHLVTNGVDQALMALDRGIEVTLLGGTVKRNTHAIAGMTAYKQLEKMNFAFAFMGMNGLSEKQGLTTTNIEEATLKELAMNQSQKIRILMDESKLNQVYEYKVEAPSQAIILINQEAEDKKIQSINKLKDKYDMQFVAETMKNK
jgi:DeoR family fructose operon transcriptional repressor